MDQSSVRFRFSVMFTAIQNPATASLRLPDNNPNNIKPRYGNRHVPRLVFICSQFYQSYRRDGAHGIAEKAEGTTRVGGKGAGISNALSGVMARSELAPAAPAAPTAGCPTARTTVRITLRRLTHHKMHRSVSPTCREDIANGQYY
jgi:hypothetical protein